MNKEVANAIKEVVNAWLTGERNYVFETRGIKSCKPHGTGEYIYVFYLHVVGFYTDSSLRQSINLNFTSLSFITQNLGIENLDNPQGDASCLNRFLEIFTKDCYDKIKVEIEKYPSYYYLDFLRR